MKKQTFITLLYLFSLLNLVKAQSYYPLPTQNALWTVYEWDEYGGGYDDKIYTVNGDTLINALTYTKIFKLNDYPTIYDTIKTLHCLMRQDSLAKKIWFIRYYLGETTEKLGFNLSVAIGDTVSLPAFDYGNVGDSIFILGTKNPDLVDILPNGKRTYFGFSSELFPGRTLGFIEGITCMSNTFPDRFYYWDPFHQSYTPCVYQNNAYIWPASSFPIDTTHCGFNLVQIKDLNSTSIRIYPNPANNYCVLELPESIRNFELNLIDLFGKSLLALKPSASEYVNLDVSNYPSGIYILQLKSLFQTYAIKIVVLH